MGYEKHIFKQNAYTIFEIIIVTVIISVLASVAIPRYTTTLEKARLGEGLQIIEALYKAQRAIFFETGAYATTLAAIDVIIPTPRYFNPLTNANLGAGPLATVTRRGSYTLSVNANGRITCGPVALAAICNQIGCRGAGNLCN